MRLSRGWTCAAAAAALGLAAAAAPAAAPTTEPTPQQLLEQIKQLQAKVEQLQERPVYNQKDVDETVERVLNDANRRSMLDEAGGFTSGYKNGKFVIQSEDGSFLLHPWLQLDIREETNYRHDGKTIGHRVEDDTESGFELRRAKFGFDGNLFSPDLTFLMNWATNREPGTIKDGSGTTDVVPTGGVPVLEEGWAKYHIPGTDFYIKGGQIKDPLAHEQIMSSKYQMAIERSLQDDLFANGDAFVQGATVIYYNKQSPLRVEAGVTDGLKSANTNFQDFPNTGVTADWGAAGRVEYKAMGDWSAYDQFTSLKDKNPLLVFGMGGDYTEAGHLDSFVHTADVQFNLPAGLALYADYMGRYTAHTLVAGHNYAYEPTAMGQVSWLLCDKWEPYGRFEYIYLSPAVTALPAGSAGQNNVQEITVGVNYYWHGHQAKFTVDGVYLPRGTPVADDGSGVLTSVSHAEAILRIQFQILL